MDVQVQVTAMMKVVIAMDDESIRDISKLPATPNMGWLIWQMNARRCGLFDEADLAREKIHSLDNGYGFMHFRGRQKSGDALFPMGHNHKSPNTDEDNMEAPIPEPVPVATTKPIRVKKQLEGQIGLFGSKL